MQRRQPSGSPAWRRYRTFSGRSASDSCRDRSTSMKTEQKPPTLQPSPREPLTFKNLVEPGASTCGDIRWRRRTTMNRTPRVMALAALFLTLGVPAIAGTLNSPMVFADNNGQARRIFCSVVDVGTGPIASVTVSIVDQFGN